MQTQIKRNASDPQQTSVVGIRGKHRCAPQLRNGWSNSRPEQDGPSEILEE